GRIDEFVKNRYASFDSELGKKVRSGSATLEELAAIAAEKGAPALPESGRQELLESVLNQVMFG
ncbi:MAG: xylose isomerase, partial [Oscillospiraceae bacterium]|nr:xylose isomerase [Oscillospiraceae bacterium]